MWHFCLVVDLLHLCAEREGSIHHGAVMCCLRGLSGGRGTRRKISGLRLCRLARSLPSSWASVSRECHTGLLQGTDPPLSPGNPGPHPATDWLCVPG